MDWLRHQPLIHSDTSLNYLLVHAGVPPQWDLDQALSYAQEISDMLQGPNFRDFLVNLHGNLPDQWKNDLKGWDRLRYMTNALTRIRFCDAKGQLDLLNKTNTTSDPTRFKPWFEWRNDQRDIIFGHWAALEGRCEKQGIFAIDTGCVWGESLTALRLEDRQLFSVPA